MFSYQKRLLFPVYVEHPDDKFASVLFDHYGGKDGEFTAFTRLLSHRLHMTNPYVRDLIGMIAAEELGHMEMIGVALKKLGMSELPICNAKEEPWTIQSIEVGEDVLRMLKINEAAEDRMRKLYLKSLNLTKDVHLKKMIQFLITREEVHQSLFKKTSAVIAQGASNEQLSAIIHEYKMSLRIVK